MKACLFIITLSLTNLFAQPKEGVEFKLNTISGYVIDSLSSKPIMDVNVDIYKSLEMILTCDDASLVGSTFEISRKSMFGEIINTELKPGGADIDVSNENREEFVQLYVKHLLVDSDGYMQITDRVKDVIKSGGEWISTIEIENIAIAHPKILEAAVVGVLHHKWDERPLLIIVAKEEIAKKEVFAYLEDKIAKWWMPDDILFLNDLPHTATGKVRKVELKKKYKTYLTSKD